MKKKFFKLETLKELLEKEKIKGRKIVHCHGVFDLIHIGHIKHFKESKRFGDILVVTVTPDRFVDKGHGRPAFKERTRIEALEALEDIDYLALNTEKSALSAIRKIKPNFYCKGPDYKNFSHDLTGKISDEVKEVKKFKGRVIFTKSETFSSTRLINENSGILSNEQKIFIKNIKKNNNFISTRKKIDNFKKLKVLLVGEIIIDQYVFCEALGKSGKEPVLALRDLYTEEYLGGAGAISNHLSTFCKNIKLLSMLGEREEFKQFINSSIQKNVNLEYIKKKNSPTIIKRRFLDHVSHSKVLGVYKINDELLTKQNEKNFNNILIKNLKKFDLVIVSDYGHGLISKKSAEIITKYSKFLALNAQVNAANIGYHTMRNYKNLDCVIINEKEIRHETRDKNTNIEKLMINLSNVHNIKNLIVTRGSSGSTIFNSKSKKFFYSPAFAKATIDKIGAGDAMLSMASLCLKMKLQPDITLLISSLAAAYSVENVGNKNKISKMKILKNLENLFK